MTSGLVVAFWVMLGAATGSFLNVVVDRLPEGRSFLSPPSHCAACDHRLSPAELVPVWSYLALQGRCRVCSVPIGVRTFILELGTGLLFGLEALKVAPREPEEWVTLVLASAYLAVLVVVTVTDLEHGLILNKVIIPAIGLGLIGALLAGWPHLLLHLGGGLLGSGVIILIITLVPGGMGWGDVRLAGFIGLVTRLPGVLFALFVGFVSGGIVAGALLASGRRKPGETIPLGPFLAFGGGTALLYGEEMLQTFYALAALLG
ncbi:MAG: prepilin peptidase [Chloroflexota bacterium]|nr:prepilin peptidase [Chloroflexota bacterium]